MNASGSTRAGVGWLLTDMTLVTIMTVLVKTGGATYPAVQMVFIRSLIGMISVLPVVWHNREKLRTARWGRHSFRVLCNTIALNANFAALTALPLSLVNAISFMRPLLVLALATIMLNERSGPWRWAGAAFGFVGVLIMVGPTEVPFNMGLLAAGAMVVFGSLATVQTRALAGENTALMMIFYTVGLTVFTAIPAFLVWEPVRATDWPLLLSIGILAQIGQYCYLRAYQTSPANVLAPFSYLSIIFASTAGFLAFGEVPLPTTVLGIAIILTAIAISNRLDQPAQKPTT